MFRHHLLRALVLAPLGLCGAVAAPNAPSLRLATHELPPYTSQAEGQPSGLAVEVVICVAGKLNVPVHFSFLPWARAQVEARAGLFDGFFAASRSAERDTYATLSDTIAPQEWRWYYLSSNPLQPGSAAFKATAKVSSFLGANMQSWLGDNGYRVEPPPIDNTKLLRMLHLGRLDAILANHLVMERLLASEKQPAPVASTLEQDRPLGVYFTHRFTAQHPDFVQRFNAEVPACLRNSLKTKVKTQTKTEPKPPAQG